MRVMVIVRATPDSEATQLAEGTRAPDPERANRL
jgi:hypothetical protein